MLLRSALCRFIVAWRSFTTDAASGAENEAALHPSIATKALAATAPPTIRFIPVSQRLHRIWRGRLILPADLLRLPCGEESTGSPPIAHGAREGGHAKFIAAASRLTVM